MKHPMYVAPALLGAVGAFLIVTAARADELVELWAGRQLPKGLAALIGAVVAFGAVAVAVELVNKQRKESAPIPRR